MKFLNSLENDDRTLSNIATGFFSYIVLFFFHKFFVFFRLFRRQEENVHDRVRERGTQVVEKCRRNENFDRFFFSFSSWLLLRLIVGFRRKKNERKFPGHRGGLERRVYVFLAKK